MRTVECTKEDFRIFHQKLAIAESRGIEIPHMVEKTQDSDTYKITLLDDNQTLEELDRATS